MSAAAIVFVLAGVWLGQVTKADSGTSIVPGSANDPVVTKSYVDQRLAALGQGGPVSSGSGGSVNAGGGFVVVTLQSGQSVVGGAGSEIILRSGSATAISSASGAVSDVTTGADLAQGSTVSKNHLLIVSRDDGRGIQATSNSVYVLVSGSHQIK